MAQQAQWEVTVCQGHSGRNKTQPPTPAISPTVTKEDYLCSLENEKTGLLVFHLEGHWTETWRGVCNRLPETREVLPCNMYVYGKEELGNCLLSQHRCSGSNLALWEPRDLWPESKALTLTEWWILVCLRVAYTVPSSKCTLSRELWTPPALSHFGTEASFSLNSEKHIRYSKKFHYLLSEWFWNAFLFISSFFFFSAKRLAIPSYITCLQDVTFS